MSIYKMKIVGLALLSILSLCPTWAQITQSHPEYCGISGGVNPPLLNISATLNPNSHTVLYVGQSGSVVTLSDYFITEISEICPLSDGRLVVFGDMGGTEVYIVDPTKASVLDSFMAYRPVMSPNQRWIAFIKFYPLHGVQGSDEIMLYDLSKTPAQNRPDGDVKETIDVGNLIFPPGHQNFPGSNVVTPSDNRIIRYVMQLSWASNSHAILFEDRAESDPGIALVTIDQNGAASAFRHTLSDTETCGRVIAAGTSPQTWRLDRAEFAPNGAITLDISSDGCAPHVLQLSRDDFQPATSEIHVRPKLRPTIVDGPKKQ